MKKQVIRLTENDLHTIIENAVMQALKEEGEGGATSCANVMQGGGTNTSAGQYDVPFGADGETKKRSKDFDNDSMIVQRKPIYKPKK